MNMVLLSKSSRVERTFLLTPQNVTGFCCYISVDNQVEQLNDRERERGNIKH
jgi:hypothetical protein